jgi:hypothetical protein
MCNVVCRLLFIRELMAGTLPDGLRFNNARTLSACGTADHSFVDGREGSINSNWSTVASIDVVGCPVC